MSLKDKLVAARLVSQEDVDRLEQSESRAKDQAKADRLELKPDADLQAI